MKYFIIEWIFRSRCFVVVGDKNLRIYGYDFGDRMFERGEYWDLLWFC